MAPVKSVCKPQDRCQFGNYKISLSVDRTVPCHLLIIIKFQMIKFNYIGHDLPFLMGQTNDLCCHDDTV